MLTIPPNNPPLLRFIHSVSVTYVTDGAKLFINVSLLNLKRSNSSFCFSISRSSA